MPRIDFTKEATAIGVGAADELLEFVDRNQGFSSRPFRNATDWGRLAIAGVGGFMWSQNQMTDFSDVLLYSGSTLAVKSVSRVLREGFAGRRRASSRSYEPAAARGRQRALPSPSAVEHARTGSDMTLLITRV